MFTSCSQQAARLPAAAPAYPLQLRFQSLRKWSVCLSVTAEVTCPPAFPFCRFPPGGGQSPDLWRPARPSRLCSARAGRRLRWICTSGPGEAPSGTAERTRAALCLSSSGKSTHLLALPPVVHRASDIFIIHNFQALTGKSCSCVWSTGICKFGPGLKSAFCFPAKFTFISKCQEKVI